MASNLQKLNNKVSQKSLKLLFCLPPLNNNNILFSNKVIILILKK